MSLFSKLFGGGIGGDKATAPEPDIYKDFRIYPEPAKAAGGFRVEARIEKEIGGEVKRHHMVRADVIAAQDEAMDACRRKARQMIDEQGDGLF